ncbi:RcnB family protein [Pseudomonas cannabina]|uniref:Lipoprotein n=1 Tax=Pseudomonas cannabina TaxID=86840 RepID=A0A0P9L2D0_PSECA|nr:RcnB family protein [Pseudomonas cannabina]KAA8719211.1 RcnB family protein [Pseudomonas cannabina]KPW63240.1 Lipoprotein [Pseudomonas cannabina]RMN32960.1 Lipoprotein [Pseudomonas cannabina]SDQ99794.1 Nickel/cobalt transporter regulator [Pseudomonas cannabina]
MNSKSLIACMTLLGCFSAVTLPVHAAETPDPKIAKSKDNVHELELGSRVPEKYRRSDLEVKDWKSKGLEEPAKESEWVKINDKYVRFQKVNGNIMDIVPVKK